jgi:hypothetical protein
MQVADVDAIRQAIIPAQENRKVGLNFGAFRIAET